MSEQPVNALRNGVTSRKGREGKRGGGGRSSVREETQMMTGNVAIFSEPAAREPRGESVWDSATARSVTKET
jgi:hypothetical protein